MGSANTLISLGRGCGRTCAQRFAEVRNNPLILLSIGLAEHARAQTPIPPYANRAFGTARWRNEPRPASHRVRNNRHPAADPPSPVDL